MGFLLCITKQVLKVDIKKNILNGYKFKIK